MSRLDLIIPVINEAGNVRDLTLRLHRTLSEAGIDYRLIFVDDHSSDSTVAILQELSLQYPLTIHIKQGRKGKAFSILEGARLCTSPVIGMIDGDLQYPPEAIPGMVSLAATHGVVVANRKAHHTSVLRQFISKANRYLVGKMFLGFDCDVQSGLKLFRRDILDHLDSSHVDAWALDMPLLHTALELGYSIGSVEIEFAKRAAGGSKLNVVRGSWEIGRRAVKVRLAHRKIYSIKGEGDSMIGSGFAYKRRRFITHSSLHPDYSAIKTFHFSQKLFVAAVLAAVLAGLYLAPLSTGIAFIAVLSLVYFIDVLFSFFVVFKSLHFPPELSFFPQQLDAVNGPDLPTYSILCPLYKEARVLRPFLESIAHLDWPKDKLDVLLLLEEDDHQTREAADSLPLPPHVRVVVVPDSRPKTKPKACNYGLSLAKGEYVVIYDAEDRPDPQQLKKAYLAFKASPKKVVCLQAKLNYYNPNHNLLTRLFTAEYSLWFDVVLPGLQSVNTTIPLGGTSNHFKTDVLRQLHGWDAFNVTEDCDLGARLFKSGFRTALIDSTTMEEANSHLGNWIRQRSRWIKGYIQTYLVHNRKPLQFFRTHGIHAFIFQLVIGLRISFMLINPLLWLVTIAYFTMYPLVGLTIEALFPPAVFYLAGFSMVAGNFLYVYYYMIGCAKRNSWELIKYVYLVPVYWLAVSVAAVKAATQLIFRPHYWEKTHHGLHLAPVTAAVSVVVPVPDAVVEPVVIPAPSPVFSPVPVNTSGIQVAVKGSRRPTFRFPFVFPTLVTSRMASGATLVAASVIANFANFLYNTYLGRTVSLSEFGLISAVGSITYFVQIPINSLSRTVTYRSAYLFGKFGSPVPQFWTAVRRRSITLSLLGTILWLAAIPWLSGFFQSDSTLPFILFTPIWLLGAVGAVDSGYLSGNLKFAVLATMVVVEAVGKLGWAYFFVSLGWSHVVYASIPLASLTSFIVGYAVAKSLKPGAAVSATRQALYFPRRFFFTSVLTAVSSVAFLSVDVVLAKHFLSPESAGEYALLSLAGKMVFFSGSLFGQFITPLVSHEEGSGRQTRAVFYKLLLATSLACLAGYVAIGVYGHITVPVLFGQRAMAILKYLPLYASGMAAFAVASAIVNYHQTRRHYLFPVVSVVCAAAQFILMGYFHSGVLDLVRVVSAVGGVFLATVAVLHIFYERLLPLIRAGADFLGLFRRLPSTPTPSPAQLRILIFNWRDTRHVWGGGAEVYVQELARRWTALGHHVTLFCGNDGKSPHSENVEGIKVIRRGGFYTVYIWAALYYIFRFRGRFDVVVDSENGIPFFTPLYIRVPKFLLIHHVHQNVFRAHLRFPLAQIAILLECRLMPWVYRGQKIITVSESSRKDIQALGKWRGSDIQVINPGVTVALPTYTYPKSVHPSFAYVGRIRPYKNVDVALKAFASVLEKFPDSRFHIAGWGESLPDLKALAEKLNISHAVVFWDRVSETDKVMILSSAWAMIQPSSFEGWGITVIEANACGTPVIASNVIGLRDSVIDRETGILVPPQRVSALADAMTKIISDTQLRETMSTRARVWAANFDWDTNAGVFLETMRTQLEESRRSTPGMRFIFARKSSV